MDAVLATSPAATAPISEEPQNPPLTDIPLE